MALKTFPYAAIVNGEIIPPNTPVEMGEKKNDATKAEAKKPTKKAGVKNDEGTNREP